MFHTFLVQVAGRRSPVVPCVSPLPPPPPLGLGGVHALPPPLENLVLVTDKKIRECRRGVRRKGMAHPPCTQLAP